MPNSKVTRIRHLSFNRSDQESNFIQDEDLDLNQIKRAESKDFNDKDSVEKINLDSVKDFELEPETDFTVPVESKVANKSSKKTSNEDNDEKSFTNHGSVKFHKNDKNDSFSTIFTKDNQEIHGIRRVFQKSIFFLIFNLISFAFLIFISIKFFFLFSNILIASLVAIATIVIYIGITNIFFIIMADRIYLFISIVAQAILLIAINTLIGLGFSPLTLIVAVIQVLMTYLAYLELEKNQLASRLFNISTIIAECTRILTTISILVFILGIFNQIIYSGTENGKFISSENFVASTILSNDSFVDRFFIGFSPTATKATGVNNLAMSKSLGFNAGRLVDSEGNEVTFREFLKYNYKPGGILLKDSEDDDLLAKCSREKIEDCDAFINSFVDQKLESWKVEAYKNLGDLSLNSPMNLVNYRAVTKQYYLNLVRDISKDNPESSKSFLPIPTIPNFAPKYIIPTAITFLIYVILMLLRIVINILITFCTWLIWQILKLTGFAKIEIETVEAEVVSI